MGKAESHDLFRVGDIVEPVEGSTLPKGPERFEYAVVIGVLPLMLSSFSGDMLWQYTTQSMNLRRTGGRFSGKVLAGLCRALLTTRFLDDEQVDDGREEVTFDVLESYGWVAEDPASNDLTRAGFPGAISVVRGRYTYCVGNETIVALQDVRQLYELTELLSQTNRLKLRGAW